MTLFTHVSKIGFCFFAGAFFILCAGAAHAQNYNTRSNVNTNSATQDTANRFSNERQIINKKFVAERVETKEIKIDAQNPIFKIIQSGRVDDVRFKNLNALQDIYANNHYQPIFLTNTRRAKNTLNEYYEVFLDSWSHGLNPSQYHTQAIYKFLSADNIDDESVAKADLILTDAVIRHGQDLTGSRIIPSKLGYHTPSINKGVVAHEVIQFVSKMRNPEKAFAQMAPNNRGYLRMREELMQLFTTPDGDTDKISITGLIKPRTNHPAIPKIRARMGTRSDNLPQGKNFYDDELAATIMSFQRANGLQADGVIGPETANVINLSKADKIRKLIVNMERVRWEDQDKPDRYILVNIPSERLWAVSNGRTEIEMAVVVGRPERPTIAFNSSITGVRINPTWTIPPTIKREDFATKLRQDAAYLDNRGIKLYKGGERLDSSNIDWSTVSDGELGGYRMVQGPSSSNPLGRFRVLMNNPYNIYLHDTPTKSYFSRSNRALSSGCVRMEDAELVTDFILRTNPDWTEERKKAILESGDMKEVSAGESLPVFLQYKTVWIGDDNQLVYGHDIYEEDKKLYNALKTQGDIFIPKEI